MYEDKGTILCFLKGLEDMYNMPLFFPFVLVILANYWKMGVLAKRKSNFDLLKNRTSAENSDSEREIMANY